MKKCNYKCLANTTNPGRYFDAASNLHGIVGSEITGPDK